MRFLREVTWLGEKKQKREGFGEKHEEGNTCSSVFFVCVRLFGFLFLFVLSFQNFGTYFEK